MSKKDKYSERKLGGGEDEQAIRTKRVRIINAF